MILKDAEREFNIRHYYWSISEAEHEVQASFPVLRQFKAGLGWAMYRSMLQLEPDERPILARAWVKRGDMRTREQLGETLTHEENKVLKLLDSMAVCRSSFQVEYDRRKAVGEKVRFVSRHKLRKAMVAKFIEVFGSQCVKMQIGEGWDPLFNMKCCGWMIVTQFWFGRSQPLISHIHMIQSPTTVPHHTLLEIDVPETELTRTARWPFGYDWMLLLENDLESACEGAIRACRHFFEAAPKLLRGLDFGKLETLKRT